MRRLPAEHEGGNIKESYTKFYKAEVFHGEHIFLIFLTRRDSLFRVFEFTVWKITIYEWHFSITQKWTSWN